MPFAEARYVHGARPEARVAQLDPVAKMHGAVGHRPHRRRRLRNCASVVSAFVYSRGLNDFHIADTLGNSQGTVATVLVFASVFGRSPTQTLFVLRATAIAVGVYELAHPLLGKPIDPFDLLATVLAGFLCQCVSHYLSARTQP